MAGSFSADLSKFAEKYEANIRIVVRKFAFEAIRSIILLTPVDTGRARAHWSVAIDKPKNLPPSDATDKSGGKALGEAAAVVNQFSGDGSVFVTNNLPYIPPLEYGGYPNPPKSTSGKTEGGFSRQAPNGMVRITCEKIQEFISKATEGM